MTPAFATLGALLVIALAAAASFETVDEFFDEIVAALKGGSREP